MKRFQVISLSLSIAKHDKKTKHRKRNIFNITIDPFDEFQIFRISFLKKGYTIGLKCIIYTAKHEVANWFMVLLVKFHFTNVVNRASEDKITRGLSYRNILAAVFV